MSPNSKTVHRHRDLFIIRKNLFLTVLVCIVLFMPVFAQEGGLYFESYERIPDDRTGINLTPESPLCFEKQLSLSFDLKFRPNQEPYYGYVFRVIVNDELNIDLISEDYTPSSRRFSLVVGDKQKTVNLSADATHIYDWQPINMTIDTDKNLVSVVIDNQELAIEYPLDERFCAHIQMGVVRMPGFSSTDVPPIAIRNITLSTRGSARYNWPLDEEKGDTVIDIHQGAIAVINNPVWIKSMNRRWLLENTVTSSTGASFAFNPDKGLVYIVGQNNIKIYNLSKKSTETVPYADGHRQLLPQGNQSFYVDQHDKLYNFYLDAGRLSSFDWEERRWSATYPGPSTTFYWHANKFYSAIDSSFYVLGGYGYWEYKKSIFRAGYGSSHLEEIAVENSDVFTPRYLAGLGSTAAGAYIIGGYGSKSGKQSLNPKHLHDFLFFDLKQMKMEKIYELPQLAGDVVFANSLVIDSVEGVFYGLVHQKEVYQTALKLIRGSLSEPKMEFVGDSIPFTFYDITSFSDLYYAPRAEKLIAITALDDGDESVLNIYSIQFPPDTAEYVDDFRGSKSTDSYWIWLGVLVGGVLIVVGYTYATRQRQKVLPPIVQHDTPDEPDGHTTGAIDEGTAPQPDPPVANEPQPNSMYLFGNFQVYDRNGTDITKGFTRVVRELLLAILLYTIRSGRGISSEMLYELIWHDKPIESARNNRSVNTAKLRQLLKELNGIEVSKETGYWKLDIDHKSILLDYAQFWAHLEDEKDRPLLERMINATEYLQRGTFLADFDYTWLDEFKSQVSNAVADTYLQVLRETNVLEDSETHLQLANRIAHFDQLNEEAMVVRCILMSKMRLHSQAHNTYHNFVNEYQRVYGESFELSFKDILGRY